ncbi:MAG TPA: HdeD family acid-resistance protein [Candidatus Sulfotelmatobacter sp.]|nr:HdeD family acid-resistance protein [Candidatus Sulfotelmatobacter sp.]
MTENTTTTSRPSIPLAVLLIVLGMAALALPALTSWSVVLVIAWLIISSGVIQFIHAFRSKGAGTILWKVVVALLYLVVGGYLVFHPLLGAAALTLMLAVFFVVEGATDLAAYFRVRRAPGAGWIFFDGVITLLLGVLVWRHWPSGSLWVIAALVGISMISTGVTRLMIGLAARRRQIPELPSEMRRAA